MSSSSISTNSALDHIDLGHGRLHPHAKSVVDADCKPGWLDVECSAYIGTAGMVGYAVEHRTNAPMFFAGEVSEWLKEHAWKVCIG